MAKVLFVTSSAQGANSTSTKLGERLIARIPGAVVTRRDIGKNPPPSVDQASQVEGLNTRRYVIFLVQEWVGANFTPADKRTSDQIAKLSISSAFVAELKDADIVVISVAVYNLSIPSSLKAWIDLVTITVHHLR